MGNGKNNNNWCNAKMKSPLLIGAGFIIGHVTEATSNHLIIHQVLKWLSHWAPNGLVCRYFEKICRNIFLVVWCCRNRRSVVKFEVNLGGNAHLSCWTTDNVTIWSFFVGGFSFVVSCCFVRWSDSSWTTPFACSSRLTSKSRLSKHTTYHSCVRDSNLSCYLSHRRHSQPS